MADFETNWELIPEVPRDIVLTDFVPKLSWTTLQILGSASPAWQRAIRSREVYNTRIWSGSRETLVVIKHKHLDDGKPVLSLYSTKKETFYSLPPLPDDAALSRFSHLYTAHGTVYVDRANCQCNCFYCTDRLRRSGASMSCTSLQDANRMYKLDLAADSQLWEEVPAFPPTRPADKAHPEADPDWVSNELELRGDKFKRVGTPACFSSQWLHYNPTVSEWAAVNSCSTALELDKIPQRCFWIGGKYYCIQTRDNYHDLYYRDDVAGQDVLQHSITRELPPAEGTIAYPVTVEPVFILLVHNELFAIAHFNSVLIGGYCLIQTRGFGSGTREIVWQKVPHPVTSLGRNMMFAMCPIQL